MTLQASDLSNFKASFISEQFSVTKIQIFSFRKEKCLSVWSYDKNISMYILTKTYLYKKHVFVQRDLQERVIYKNDSRFEAIRLFHLIYYDYDEKKRLLNLALLYELIYKK